MTPSSSRAAGAAGAAGSVLVSKPETVAALYERRLGGHRPSLQQIRTLPAAGFRIKVPIKLEARPERGQLCPQVEPAAVVSRRARSVHSTKDCIPRSNGANSPVVFGPWNLELATLNR